MNEFVAYGLIASAFAGIVGTAFTYDVIFSGAMYFLAGLGLYIFGIWAAVLLLREEK